MKNIIIILITSLLYSCVGDTVNHQVCAIYGDQRVIVDTVYLNDNGIHVDIVIPNKEGYISYGWGATQFFIYHPTLEEAEYIDFLHVIIDGTDVVIRETNYSSIRSSWIPVGVTQEQLDSLKHNIDNSYVYNDEKLPIKVNDPINGRKYYEAVGKYTHLYTCNTWTNEMLKNSGMYARKHAVFSSQVINLYN
mgnify:FL=1|tara:strand:- start:167 stop:742 length:576 start_codon:yes stop_codon:yes gene_type:complete